METYTVPSNAAVISIETWGAQGTDGSGAFLLNTDFNNLRGLR